MAISEPHWKKAPEHRRLSRYSTMSLDEIMELPVAQIVQDKADLYLWVPNALIPEGLEVMRRWGFNYKTNIVWFKTRKDGGPDGRGVGFYFRNVTEVILFGTRGNNNRTLKPGRTQTNIIRFQASGTTFIPGKPTTVLNVKYVAGSTTRGYDLRSYDVSADGQRFLMLKETAGASTSAPLPTMTVVVHWIEELKSRVPAK